MPHLESVRLLSGVPQLWEYHLARIARVYPHLDARGWIEHITSSGEGVEKCRLCYDATGLRSIEVMPYCPRQIRSLRCVEVPNIDYHEKYADRRVLEALTEGLPDDTLPLITRGGLLTDTTYTNIVLESDKGELHTPASPLLEGVMRAWLLDEGRIETRPLHRADLASYRYAHLINALMPLGYCRVELIPQQ